MILVIAIAITSILILVASCALVKIKKERRRKRDLRKMRSAEANMIDNISTSNMDTTVDGTKNTTVNDLSLIPMSKVTKSRTSGKSKALGIEK